MTKASPWKLSRAAISAIERGQNFPGMEAMLALSQVLYVDPKEIVERARLSTAVPIDITDLTYEDLELKASKYFWDGDFRKSLSVYDAMLEKLALEPQADEEWTARRVAVLDVRRATALKRAGALLSAIATAERAISVSVDFPSTQAEAYIVLADLQVQRGHLPLAQDAAQRAIELCNGAGSQIKGWAWMVKGRVLYLAGSYEEAREAWEQARDLAAEAGDTRHRTHIEGDIGMCWLALGQPEQAESCLQQAVELAREYKQPALEASWLVELGKLAFAGDRMDSADRFATEALALSEPHEQVLTIFRAEWLRFRVQSQRANATSDTERLDRLRKLFLLLDQHEGIDEVQEFKKAAHRLLTPDERKKP